MEIMIVGKKTEFDQITTKEITIIKIKNEIIGIIEIKTILDLAIDQKTITKNRRKDKERDRQTDTEKNKKMMRLIDFGKEKTRNVGMRSHGHDKRKDPDKSQKKEKRKEVPQETKIVHIKDPQGRTIMTIRGNSIRMREKVTSTLQ